VEVGELVFSKILIVLLLFLLLATMTFTISTYDFQKIYSKALNNYFFFFLA